MESTAGLTPITASPAPMSKPSMQEAAMPEVLSVGWLGWMRMPKVPAMPVVFLQRAMFLILAAIAINSLLARSLVTAATISGVSPC